MSKNYKDGPIPLQQRSCTDVCCLIIFILVTVAMLCIGIYSWTNGNFKRLTTAYDPDGKGCGVDYPTYPYIYFASPHADSLWVTVCVSKCPQQGDKKLECQPNSVVKACLPVKNADNTQSVEIYNSSKAMNTACLPTSDTLKTEIASALGGSTESFSSILENYVLIILSLPIAIVLALIIMLFVRLTASCFIYLLIVVTVGVLIAFGVYLILGNKVSPDSQPIFASDTTRILIAVGAFVLALLIIIMVCCFRKRLSLASSIVKVSANFVSSNCFIVFLPILLFFVMIIFIALWILEGLGYYSLGTPKVVKHQYPFQHFDVPGWIIGLGIFHVFYLLWNLFFFIETGSFMIGGAACSWYYKRTDPTPYSQASLRYRKKHIGSVCLGSFFMALLGILKFIYELITPEQKEGETGILATYKKCCDCICCLCTSFLFKWFNSGAYTVINMVGDSYCTAAGRAFEIRVKNLATSSIVAIVQVLFTFLIRLGITFLTVFVVYMLIQYVPSYKETIQDASLILIVVGLIAFTIACFFVSVYSDAMDSIYVTYLLDIDDGDSSNKYCPQQLKDFLEEAEKGNTDL